MESKELELEPKQNYGKWILAGLVLVVLLAFLIGRTIMKEPERINQETPKDEKPKGETQQYDTQIIIGKNGLFSKRAKDVESFTFVDSETNFDEYFVKVGTPLEIVSYDEKRAHFPYFVERNSLMGWIDLRHPQLYKLDNNTYSEVPKGQWITKRQHKPVSDNCDKCTKDWKDRDFKGITDRFTVIFPERGNYLIIDKIEAKNRAIINVIK